MGACNEMVRMVPSFDDDRIDVYVTYLDSHTNKKFWIGQGKLNDLSKLPNLFIEATNLRKRDTAVFFRGLHVEYRGVNFSWKDSHDGQGCHVEGHTSPRF